MSTPFSDIIDLFLRRLEKDIDETPDDDTEKSKEVKLLKKQIEEFKNK